MLDLLMTSLIQTPGLCVCEGGGGRETFNTFTTHAGLAHDVTDTDSWAVCMWGGGGERERHLIHLPHMLDLLMTSLIQTPRLKMAALTVMTSWPSSTDYLKTEPEIVGKLLNIYVLFHSYWWKMWHFFTSVLLKLNWINITVTWQHKTKTELNQYYSYNTEWKVNVIKITVTTQNKNWTESALQHRMKTELNSIVTQNENWTASTLQHRMKTELNQHYNTELKLNWINITTQN